MDRGKSKVIVNEIIISAKEAAESSKEANYINVRPSSTDNASVIITTHVNGIDAAWITYNCSGLDELITVLESVRAGMR